MPCKLTQQPLSHHVAAGIERCAPQHQGVAQPSPARTLPASTAAAAVRKDQDEEACQAHTGASIVAHAVASAQYCRRQCHGHGNGEAVQERYRSQGGVAVG
jgi:hypothetical protein